MTVPKRHHYVPELLQQHFANESGGLWTFSIRSRTKGVWCSTFENLLLEGHLYSHTKPDGSKDTSLESWFSRLESITAPIITKIIANARRGKEPSLTDDERQTWDFFLYQQWRRVPDVYASLLTAEQHRAEVEGLIDELVRSGHPLSNSQRSELLEPASLQRMYKNLRVATLKTGSDAVLTTMATRGLAVARIDNPKKSFILASRPVVKFTLPNVTYLGDPRVEMWLPIAHDVMVGLGSAKDREILVSISDQQVRHCNEAAASQSSQIVGRSQELVQSLSRFVGKRIGHVADVKSEC